MLASLCRGVERLASFPIPGKEKLAKCGERTISNHLYDVHLLWAARQPGRVFFLAAGTPAAGDVLPKLLIYMMLRLRTQNH
jgi:hypothetical protein